MISLKTLSSWVVFAFEDLQLILTHDQVKIVFFICHSQLIVNFETCLEQFFLQVIFSLMKHQMWAMLWQRILAILKLV